MRTQTRLRPCRSKFTSCSRRPMPRQFSVGVGSFFICRPSLSAPSNISPPCLVPPRPIHPPLPHPSPSHHPDKLMGSCIYTTAQRRCVFHTRLCRVHARTTYFVWCGGIRKQALTTCSKNVLNFVRPWSLCQRRTKIKYMFEVGGPVGAWH